MGKYLPMNNSGETFSRVQKEIGCFVRAKRKEAGMSQEALSEKCGIVRRTLFSLEAGEGGNLGTLLSVLGELGALESSTAGFREKSAKPVKTHKVEKKAKDKQTTTGEIHGLWTITLGYRSGRMSFGNSA